MIKKVVFIDMDGVIVDLGTNINNWFNKHPDLHNKYKQNPDHIPGIFRNPPPIKGAIEAVNKLAYSGKYELYIATSVPWENSESYFDKKHWVENHFGKLFHKRIFSTHSKNMLIGDYLIDDRKKNGAVEFRGELLRFGFDWENDNKPNEYPTWEAILKKLL